MKLDDDLHKNSSDDKGFKPPPQGITAQNLTTKYVDYSNLTCTRYSNNFQDEEFQAFDSFNLSTDGVVLGTTVQMQGDSSLSFSVKDKSYVKLRITLKSTVIIPKYQNFIQPFSIPSFDVVLEGGDSFSAGTRKVGFGWDYKDLSIIKRNGEQLTSSNALNFLRELNKFFQFNTIDITWLESWSCVMNLDDGVGAIVDDDELVVPPPPSPSPSPSPSPPPSPPPSLPPEPISDETLWLILGGLILLIVGSFLLSKGSEE
jgi:hypothetical protein